MLSLEERLYELSQNNSSLLDKETYLRYEQQVKIFEELVEKNIIKKRGNQLYNSVYNAPLLFCNNQ